MKIISTVWIDNRESNYIYIDDHKQPTREFKIIQDLRTFMGVNQFIVREKKKNILRKDKWATIYDRDCFERRVVLLFNTTKLAIDYISKLEN